jgi:hypothetical protein
MNEKLSSLDEEMKGSKGFRRIEDERETHKLMEHEAVNALFNLRKFQEIFEKLLKSSKKFTSSMATQTLRKSLMKIS